MAGELLADSDFFIALYKRDDTNHERALKLLEKVGEEGTGLALSVWAYSEIATVLSQRVGQAAARNFMRDMESSGIRIIQTTAQLFEKTREVFKAQRSKNVSFTDAGNVALIRMEGFNSLVSFDKDYKKNGIRLFV
jgi:predicted nucleic acid-binding protein